LKIRFIDSPALKQLVAISSSSRIMARVPQVHGNGSEPPPITSEWKNLHSPKKTLIFRAEWTLIFCCCSETNDGAASSCAKFFLLSRLGYWSNITLYRDCSTKSLVVRRQTRVCHPLAITDPMIDEWRMTTHTDTRHLFFFFFVISRYRVHCVLYCYTHPPQLNLLLTFWAPGLVSNA
jgi:hypothetical protein